MPEKGGVKDDRPGDEEPILIQSSTPHFSISQLRQFHYQLSSALQLCTHGCAINGCRRGKSAPARGPPAAVYVYQFRNVYVRSFLTFPRFFKGP